MESRPEPAAGGVTVNCPSCRMSVPGDANFCPYCGYRLRAAPAPVLHPVSPPRRQTVLDVAEGIGAYATLLLSFLLTINVLIAIWSLGLVLPETAGSRIYLFIVVPWIVNLLELGGASFAIYYLFIVVAVTLSFIWMLWKSRKSFIRELMVAELPAGHSPVYRVGTLFFALLAFNFFYYLILGALGINPTTPDYSTGELWKIIYSLTNASVWEEIITRVAFIGIPLLLYDMLKRRKMSWKSYFLGGGMEVGKKEAILLVFSSTMFATAHLTNWDIFKFPPTFIAGLALGYLFIRFGLYASIILHFAFDYLSVPLEISDSLVVALLIGLVMLVWIAVGMVYFYYYTVRVIEYMIGRALWPPRFLRPKAFQPYGLTTAVDYSVSPKATPGMPVPSPPPGFGFVCRYCGYTEARYTDGALYCLKCGRRN